MAWLAFFVLLAWMLFQRTPSGMGKVTEPHTAMVDIRGEIADGADASASNILPAVESLYWWDGSVQSEGETAFLAKTRADLYESLQACVLVMHPYEVPCIVALDIDHGHPPFLRWVVEQTVAPGGGMK